MAQAVNNGLDRRSADEIAATIVDLGFNCVRLPYGLDMIYENRTRVPDPNVTLAANPDLRDSSPLEVFDATLKALTDRGLLVFLNNHISSSGWCCSSTDEQGLWYTEKYPERVWLDSLGFMTARYRNNSLVAGFDLRNELRPTSLGLATWGGGDAALDWSVAAVKGAKHVLAENEDMLIIITGLFYGLFLCDVPRQPVHLTEPLLRGRTVYTVHEYSWVTFHMAVRDFIAEYMFAWCCFFLLLMAVSCWLSWPRKFTTGEEPQDTRIARFVTSAFGCGRCNLSCCEQPRGCLDGCVTEVLAGSVLMLMTLLGVVGGRSVFDQCSQEGYVLAMLLRALAAMSLTASWLLWARVALRVFGSWHRVSIARKTAVQGSGNLEQPLETGSGNLEQPLETVESGGVRELEFTRPLGSRRPVLQVLATGMRSGHCLVMVLAAIAIIWLVAMWAWYGRYEVYERELDARWGFLINGQTTDSEAAPIWVGEFGADEDSLWWRHFTRYLREKDLDWAYWSFNGEKRPGESESYGLVLEDSATVRHTWKLRDLQQLMNGTALAAA